MWWQQLFNAFLRINLPKFVQFKSIKANWDHAFFCTKQDFSLL